MLKIFGLLLWKNHVVLKCSWRLILICIVCELSWFVVVHREVWEQYDMIKLPPIPLEVKSISDRPIHIFYAPSTNFTNTLLSGALYEVGRDVSIHSYDSFDDIYYAVYNIPLQGYVVGINFIGVDDGLPRTLHYEIWEAFNISSTYHVNHKTIKKREEISNCEKLMCIQAAIDKSFIDKAVNASEYMFFGTPMPISKADTCLVNILDDIDFTLIQRNAAIGLLSFVMVILISRERGVGAQQLMLKVGIPSWSYWMSWIMTCYLIELIPCIVMSYILYNVYIGTKATYIGVYLLVTMYCLASDCVYFFIISVIPQQDLAKLSCCVLWLFSHWPLLIVKQDFQFKVLTSFLPQMAVIWGYAELEELDERTCSGKVKTVANWSLSAAIGFLTLDTIIYFFLAWFIDVFFNGCFVREFPTRQSKKLSSQTDILKQQSTTKEPVVIAIKGVVYRYITDFTGKIVTKLILSDINMDILKKEVIFIVGSDDEELSTLISTIIGCTNPTSGSVTVNGMNPMNFWKIGRYVGICLEKPLFFSGLSPKENLMFFSMFRGRSMKQAAAEAEMVMNKLRIKNTIYKYSKSMHKRLCIGMALIGSPPILVLAQPTAGLGASERRIVWRTVDLFSRKHTVVVSTRNRDEADNLADRIAFLHCGRILVYGTNLWIKQQFGSGYNISVKTENGDNDNAISTIVQQFVPEANMVKHYDILLTYKIPYETRDQITAIINAIEEKKTELGILNIYVGITSLDEVYEKIVPSPVYSLNNSSIMNTETQNIFHEKHEILRYQVKALIFKKALYIYRFVAEWKFLGLTTFLFHVSGFVLFSKTIHSFDKHRFDLINYKYIEGGYLIEGDVPENLIRNYTSGLTKVTEHFSQVLNMSDLEDLPIGVVITEKEGIFKMNAIYGPWVGDICWKSVNLVTNAVLQSVDPQFKIVTEKRIFDIFLIHNKTLEALLFSCFGFVIILAYFPLLPMMETQGRTKRMQWLSGITDIMYWSVCYLVDAILYSAFVCAVVGLIAYVNSDLELYDILAVLVLLCMFGFCAIPVTYLHVCIFNSYIQVVTSILVQCIISVIIIVSFINYSHYLTMKILNFYPFLGLISAVLKLYVQLSENLCVRVKHRVDCTKSDNVCCLYPCTDNSCLTTKPYFDFSTKENHGIGDAILRFSIGTVLVTLLFIVSHFTEVQRRLYKIIRKIYIREHDKYFKEDTIIHNEKELAYALSHKIYDNRYLLVVDNVTKIYTKGCFSFKYFPPVDSVTLTIRRGEFFALVGRGDSGKTVLVNMIVGDEFPSKGRIRLFSSSVGYCPGGVQMFSNFTAYENLMFFARIRGMLKSQQYCEVDKMLKAFGLWEVKDEYVYTFNRAQMQKLGISAAMIGDPEFLIMDISSTGFDPKVGQHILQSIRQIQKPWQSVLVTADSLDIMEGICTRFAVIRDGKLLSTKEWRRIQEDSDFQLILKIYINMVPYDEVQYDLLMKAIETKFENKLELKLQKRELLLYNIVDTTIKITTLVKGLVDLRKEFVELEDFSIQKPSMACKLFNE